MSDLNPVVDDLLEYVQDILFGGSLLEDNAMLLKDTDRALEAGKDDDSMDDTDLIQLLRLKERLIEVQDALGSLSDFIIAETQ